MVQIVDSHCHLDFPQFQPDLADTLTRAREAGVIGIVTVCTKPSQVEKPRELAERFDAVHYSVGVHPHYVATEAAITVDELVDLARHPKMVAIGETGLDYHYTRQIAESQKSSMRLHIEAARRTGLPLIVHARDADDDISDILTSESRNGEFNCVMHCYSSGDRLARTALDLGFYLSMSGIITFRNAAELRKIFKSVPVDRILIETDAPYLAPTPWRGKRNEPAMVERVATVGAALLEMPVEEFARQTTSNFARLFSKARIPGLS